MYIRKLIVALGLLFTALPALAQTTNPWPRMIPVRPDGSVIDPGSVGGGSGGTVSQGVAAADTAVNRWPVLAYQGGSWTFALSGAIPAGSNVIGAVTQSGAPWTIQGVAGGVPQNTYAGQYNVTLPTLSTGASTYLAVDSNGRLIQSPGFALDATIQARLGTLGQKTASASTPVTIASDQSAVPTSTTRSVTYSDASYSAVAAGATLYGGARSSIASASKFNIWAGCVASGATIVLQGSNDNFASTGFIVASGTVGAASAIASGEATGGGTVLSGPVFFTSYRARLTNGGTANNCTIVSSFTAN